MIQNSINSKIIRSKSPPLSIDKQYLKSLSTLNDRVIEQSIKQSDYVSALSLLTQLQSSIKSTNYGTYSANKKHYYYHLFVCYHNTALTYQQKNQNGQAREYMDRAIANYQRLQGYITNREENVAYMTQLVKLQLQYCGLLSHCDIHQQAAALSEKSLDRIVQSSRILQAICYQQVLLNEQRETTCSSREKGRNQMVNFKSLVIEEAQLLLQELAQLPPCHKLVTQNKSHFQKIISKIFSWKENQSNNEIALKRELKLNKEKSSRNILGLQKQSVHSEYQIGTLMILDFKQITYSPHPDPLRLLSSHSLKHMAFCAAVAYFTIATQTRFSEPDLSDIRGSMKIEQKYRKLNHDQRLLKCKILHLKALEIAGKLLPSNNSLFGHLCQSFTRNYKFVLDQINQVSEMNSINTIRFEEKQKEPRQLEREQSSIQTEYGIKINIPPKKSQKIKIDKSGVKKTQRKSNSKSQKKYRTNSNLKK